MSKLAFADREFAAANSYKIVERQIANAVTRRLQSRLNESERQDIVEAHRQMVDAQNNLRSLVDDIVDRLFSRG